VVWSAIAVLALIGMNWWVARSVSEPLAELASSVARVADGDYSAKVEASGSNEIAALAENFNQMTDSLKERSESLTKKVLELATLYEMSRALGSTLDLDALLKSVLDSAMRIFGAEVGYVTMTDRETGELRIRAQHGVITGPDVANRLRSSMSEWVVREGRPLIFNPPRAEDHTGQTEAVSGALAALCVPLLSAEGPIGALTVGTFDQERRFTADDVRLLATIANQVTIAIGNIGLFSSVQEAYLATVRALAAAVDAKDPYTRGHSDGVAAFALMIGAKLELSPDQMVALEMAAYLHDIGKIGISEDILLKPGKLTESEMSRMRHHPLIGANILKPVAFPWPIAPVVRHHHEHYDGNGYPAGLRGDEIPLLARVLTVADAFEAMIADRPYRRGRSHQEAILELRRCAGTHFDPRVVEAFISALESVETTGPAAHSVEAEVGPEEMQAVYVAVCDGMYAGFRRLGGPRLARNLEERVNERLRSDGLPLTLNGGHLVIDDEAAGSDDRLAEHLRCAVTVIAEHIEQASGAGLADHFLAEALDGLPERMRAHAAQLGLQTSV
jgi:putative nucleotidyltransferase with HDIG domain